MLPSFQRRPIQTPMNPPPVNLQIPKQDSPPSLKPQMGQNIMRNGPLTFNPQTGFQILEQIFDFDALATARAEHPSKSISIILVIAPFSQITERHQRDAQAPPQNWGKIHEQTSTNIPS